MRILLLVIAVALGTAIAYVDSRPTWDDAGVTAAALFLACLALGAASPGRAWLWALAVGVWVPLVGVGLRHNYGSLIALIFPFAGAYAGVVLRKGIDLASRAAA